MLNLPIAMLKIPLLLSLVWLLQTANISITSPLSGDILRGQVEILGNMDNPNFSSAELAFSFGNASNSADSWFTIQTFPQPVSNSIITTWDTTALTDGDYTLHLRVFFQDGSSQDVVVSDLKIRNDIVLLTDLPFITVPPQFQSTPLPVVTEKPATAVMSFSLSTPLPVNPVSVTNSSIYINFTRGALIVLAIFVFAGVFLRFRNKS